MTAGTDSPLLAPRGEALSSPTAAGTGDDSPANSFQANTAARGRRRGTGAPAELVLTEEHPNGENWEGSEVDFITARQGEASDNEFATARQSTSQRSGSESGRSDSEFATARDAPIEDQLDSALDVFGTPQFVPMPASYMSAFSKTRHNRYKEVDAMLQEGMPVNGADDHGNTLLHVACQNGHKRIAKVLLRGGANVNAGNAKGQSPLHFCFAFNYQELGEYLIAKAGADPTARNHYGLTCYEGLGVKTPRI